MRRNHVIGLHEGLLHGLPVGGHQVRDVRLGVAILKRPELEVARQLAEVLLERETLDARELAELIADSA